MLADGKLTPEETAAAIDNVMQKDKEKRKRTPDGREIDEGPTSQTASAILTDAHKRANLARMLQFIADERGFVERFEEEHGPLPATEHEVEAYVAALVPSDGQDSDAIRVLLDELEKDDKPEDGDGKNGAHHTRGMGRSH